MTGYEDHIQNDPGLVLRVHSWNGFIHGLEWIWLYWVRIFRKIYFLDWVGSN